MTSTTLLSPAWQSWIRDNLARGCDSAQMVSEMVKSGMDAALAAASLGQVQASMAREKDTQPSTPAFVYETPRLSFSGNRLQTHDREVLVSLRLARPVVALFDNFMSHDECDELISQARAKLKRSAVVDSVTGQEKVIDDRSSYGTFFRLNENDFIARLDRRISEVMNWPAENGEGIQILHYPVGGEYKSHFDYFPPEDPGSQLHLAKGGQRVSTLVMYLNDVQEGGGTTFPSIHLSVTPKKGAAAYFEYFNSLGQVDPLSLHAGAPVVSGEKWIATKWMRERKYG
ncbi:MAG: 2OG-Fe(II) oxygenase [Rhodoferax sp.]|uniref:2OG-Fe(II) oxygenase n=1 Tax=Rhodoferax sp. TaxID=50421 RepID=UPI001B4F82A1|nr:2OG-Fe(II) oxygenase [Rhodoferax sp.]MBP9906945.1 2OG-Fe(II) oxygenase [Rhodoferax sp.]